MTVNVTDVVRASCSAPYRSARMLSFLFANKDSVPMKEGDRVTHRGAQFASTGRDCTATLLVDSDEGWAQLDRLARDPRTNALEAELSFSFRFGEETLEGTVRGRSCPREAGFNRCTED